MMTDSAKETKQQKEQRGKGLEKIEKRVVSNIAGGLHKIGVRNPLPTMLLKHFFKCTLEKIT